MGLNGHSEWLVKEAGIRALDVFDRFDIARSTVPAGGVGSFSAEGVLEVFNRTEEICLGDIAHDLQLHYFDVVQAANLVANEELEIGGEGG